jgi:hypothetical protein
MKIVKKIGIILIIISVLLSITYSKSFALTDDQKLIAYDILEYMAAYEESLAPNGDATQISDNDTILKIAEEYKKQCDTAGLSFEDVIKASPNYDQIIANGSKSSEYRIWQATQKLYNNEATGNTTTSTDEMEKNRTELENKIKDAVNSGLSDKTDEELKEIDSWISEYQSTYNYSDTSNSKMDTYRKNVQNEIEKRKTEGTIESDYKTATDEKNEEREEELDSISKDPMTGTLGQQTGSATHTPDEIINEGNSFLQAGTETTINGDNLTSASSTLYNILLSVGIFLAVAIGVFLGAKFMLSAAEDKAKVKEALIPYIAGCVVIFSAFIIWKLAVTLLGAI